MFHSNNLASSSRSDQVLCSIVQSSDNLQYQITRHSKSIDLGYKKCESIYKQQNSQSFVDDNIQSYKQTPYPIVMIKSITNKHPDNIAKFQKKQKLLLFSNSDQQNLQFNNQSSKQQLIFSQQNKNKQMIEQSLINRLKIPSASAEFIKSSIQNQLINSYKSYQQHHQFNDQEQYQQQSPRQKTSQKNQPPFPNQIYQNQSQQQNLQDSEKFSSSSSSQKSNEMIMTIQQKQQNFHLMNQSDYQLNQNLIEKISQRQYDHCQYVQSRQQQSLERSKDQHQEYNQSYSHQNQIQYENRGQHDTQQAEQQYDQSQQLDRQSLTSYHQQNYPSNEEQNHWGQHSKQAQLQQELNHMTMNYEERNSGSEQIIVDSLQSSKRGKSSNGNSAQLPLQSLYNQPQNHQQISSVLSLRYNNQQIQLFYTQQNQTINQNDDSQEGIKILSELKSGLSSNQNESLNSKFVQNQPFNLNKYKTFSNQEIIRISQSEEDMSGERLQQEKKQVSLEKIVVQKHGQTENELESSYKLPPQKPQIQQQAYLISQNKFQQQQNKTEQYFQGTQILPTNHFSYYRTHYSKMINLNPIIYKQHISHNQTIKYPKLKTDPSLELQRKIQDLNRNIHILYDKMHNKNSKNDLQVQDQKQNQLVCLKQKNYYHYLQKGQEIGGRQQNFQQLVVKNTKISQQSKQLFESQNHLLQKNVYRPYDKRSISSKKQSLLSQKKPIQQKSHNKKLIYADSKVILHQDVNFNSHELNKQLFNVLGNDQNYRLITESLKINYQQPKQQPHINYIHQNNVENQCEDKLSAQAFRQQNQESHQLPKINYKNSKIQKMIQSSDSQYYNQANHPIFQWKENQFKEINIQLKQQASRGTSDKKSAHKHHSSKIHNQNSSSKYSKYSNLQHQKQNCNHLNSNTKFGSQLKFTNKKPIFQSNDCFQSQNSIYQSGIQNQKNQQSNSKYKFQKNHLKKNLYYEQQNNSLYDSNNNLNGSNFSNNSNVVMNQLNDKFNTKFNKIFQVL